MSFWTKAACWCYFFAAVLYLDGLVDGGALKERFHYVFIAIGACILLAAALQRYLKRLRPKSRWTKEEHCQYVNDRYTARGMFHGIYLPSKLEDFEKNKEGIVATQQPFVDRWFEAKAKEYYIIHDLDRRYRSGPSDISLEHRAYAEKQVGKLRADYEEGRNMAITFSFNAPTLGVFAEKYQEKEMAAH